jgi:aspartate/methionine/tyrosine aminotransferase
MPAKERSIDDPKGTIYCVVDVNLTDPVVHFCGPSLTMAAIALSPGSTCGKGMSEKEARMAAIRQRSDYRCSRAFVRTVRAG